MPNRQEQLSPTQQRLFDALSDGLPHTSKSLFGLIDSQAGVESLRIMIYKLKNKLEERGLSVLCRTTGGVTQYRLVRYVDPAEEE